jgi:hypothetical protein
MTYIFIDVLQLYSRKTSEDMISDKYIIPNNVIVAPSIFNFSNVFEFRYTSWIVRITSEFIIDDVSSLSL